MKKSTLTAAAVSILFAGAASAADMAPRYAKAAPPPVAIATWTGCYIGVNGGGLWNDSRIRVDRATTFAEPADLVAALSNNRRYDNAGGTVGGTAGCNWQTNQWIVGIEGDGNWSGLRRSDFNAYDQVPILAGGLGFVARNQTVWQDVDWFATVRGRAGITFGPSLLYGTAGVAFGGVRSATNVNFVAGPVFNYDGSASDTRVGWTAGGGWEYLISPAWSFKAEYLYVALGKFSYNNISQFGFLGWRTTVDTRFHIARVGLNYHLNSPVVAKY